MISASIQRFTKSRPARKLPLPEETVRNDKLIFLNFPFHSLSSQLEKLKL